LGAIDRTALSDYNGQQYSALVDFGYTFDVHKLKFTPMASVQYMHLRVGGYTERDAGSLNLKVDSQDYDMLQTGFGAKFEYPLESKYGTFTPEIHAKWLYDFIGDKQQTTSTFSGGGGSFATNGFKPAQSTYDFGTKVSLITKNDVTLGVEYDFQIKEDYWEHTGWVNVSYKL
jgi:outer membrane autotransporter protein